MNKRVIAAVSAAVLAMLGVVLVVLWAKGADKRAFEGADLTAVVQVTRTVPTGTKTDQLAGSTKVVKLPAKAVPDGAVTDLGEVEGLATNTTLAEGEVLLASRMAAPGDRAQGKVDVPKGTQEIAIDLEGQRLVGGEVKAGDRVGVFSSFKPKEQTQPDWTNLIAHDVLVTRVDKGTADASTVATVTVAVPTLLAEKIVFTMEFGKVWLSLQNADTAKSGQKVITGADLK